MTEWTIGPGDAGGRLDKYLMRRLNAAPRGFVYKMLRKKRVKRNGGRVGGDELLQAGDTLQLYLAEETIRGFQTERPLVSTRKRAFSVVYEDGSLLVVNKPAGMLSQPDSALERDSLVDQIAAYLAEKEDAAGTFAPAVCNRLDRNTSGLVLAGKDAAMVRRVNRAIAAREIQKFYWTLAAGDLPEAGELTGYHLKDTAANRAEILESPVPGATAVGLRYRVLGRFTGGGRVFSLLEIELLTGKSHQIRAQMAQAGHPMAGDPKYGDPEANRFFKERSGLSRQFLHAARLEWPAAGFRFTAPLPADLERALKALKEEQT